MLNLCIHTALDVHFNCKSAQTDIRSALASPAGTLLSVQFKANVRWQTYINDSGNCFRCHIVVRMSLLVA